MRTWRFKICCGCRALVSNWLEIFALMLPTYNSFMTAYADIYFLILMFLNKKQICWTNNSSQRSCNLMNFDEVGRGTRWDHFSSTSLNPFIAAIKIPISPCPAYAHARLEDMLTLQPLSYRQLKSYLKHMAHGKVSKNTSVLSSNLHYQDDIFPT